jgi:hypothetical protein
LRDANPDALAEYLRHGRIQGHDTLDAAQAAAAHAALADRLDGKSTIMVTGSNTDAAAIATRVRDLLITYGHVHPDQGETLLGRDGCHAAPGDLIACRRNNHALGVTNRAVYQVTAVSPDGALTITPHPDGPDAPARPTSHPDAAGTGYRGTPQPEAQDGASAVIVLPAEYVAADVTLAYASTAHAAQGLTVDTSHLVTDGTIDTAAMYVGMSRGRDRNTTYVATPPDTTDTTNTGTGPTAVDTTAGEKTTPAPGTRRPDTTPDSDPATRAVALLQAAMEREHDNRAATVEREHDLERATRLDGIAGHIEAITRTACRTRLENHLDDLTAAGPLTQTDRARLCADQGTEHLSRLLRAVEQTGADPRAVLEQAIDRGSLTSAKSVAQVLSSRIARGNQIPLPDLQALDATRIPADIDPDHARTLTVLHQHAQHRARTLGDQLAADPPIWAVDHLGPVPADHTPERQEWIERAGTVAAHREATGWDHPYQAIGVMPGLAATERRAWHASAWHALGNPDDTLDETALTDGRLHTRIQAAKAQCAWAPAVVDQPLRSAEEAQERHRHQAATLDAQAALAEHQGETDRAEKLRAEAAEHRVAADLKTLAITELTRQAEARTAWYTVALPTIEAGQRATREAQRRGLALDTEPDRMTAAEWLAAEHAARRADDTHRAITEADLTSDHDLYDQPGRRDEDHGHDDAASAPEHVADTQHEQLPTPAGSPTMTMRQSDDRYRTSTQAETVTDDGPQDLSADRAWNIDFDTLQPLDGAPTSVPETHETPDDQQKAPQIDASTVAPADMPPELFEANALAAAYALRRAADITDQDTHAPDRYPEHAQASEARARLDAAEADPTINQHGQFHTLDQADTDTSAA